MVPQKESIIRKERIVAIILAYNCEKMLPRALSRIPRELVDDILVIDDNSKDATVRKAQELGLNVFTHHPNLGYGGNLKSGLDIAFAQGADYVVEIHGDGAQFNPISIKYALPLMAEGYDLILGSRFIYPRKALKNGMPLIRFIANIFLSFFDRLVLGLPLTEFHTGFRIYSKNLYDRVPRTHTSNDYLYSFQIIAQSAYYRMKVGEVEVEADYINEHTSHGLRGATIYALHTFVILFSFLLARMNIKFSKLFPRLVDLRQNKMAKETK